jgi:Protein of unknown function (DUF4065)
MSPVSKTAQVLKYFAQRYQAAARKGVPRKRLVKLAYLADLLSREFLSTPITALAYYRYTFGPYDSAIEDSIDELVAAGLADRRDGWESDEVFSKRLTDTGAPIAFDFSHAEFEVLRYVAENYIDMPMRELLDDVVYPSAPMKLAPNKNDVLPMSVVDGRGLTLVGFRLEDVLAAEAAIDSGDFSTSISAR